MPKGVYERTPEAKANMSKARKGIKFSAEHRANISKSLIGTQRAKGSVRTPEMRQRISERNKGKYTGEENVSWKGDAVGYQALHYWVARQLGQPLVCENCDGLGRSRYEWANISGEYKRDVSDWVRLCSNCHHLLDNQGKKSSLTKILNQIRSIA